MRVVEIDRFGHPADVVRCVDRPDPVAGEGKVVVRMAVMSINPADLLMIEGRYGERPAFPFVPGTEGVGRVESVGPNVAGLAVGDPVVPLAGSCWRDRLVARPEALIRLPPDLSLDQAAMLKANPATAEAMLTLAPLEAGDWVMQNAANSAVGRNVIIAARARGLRTVNVVRRPDPVTDLEALGADVVIVDNGRKPARLAAAVQEAVGDAGVKLAFDAIGGMATDALVAAVAQSGQVVNYGLLSSEPCQVDPYHLVFRDVHVRGFWLRTWFAEADRSAIKTLYERLIERLQSGGLTTPVEARYRLDDIAAAVDHAARPHRSGKILLTTDAAAGADQPSETR
ncbi:MAG: zinc-dependent alcohol dehydrogenase family protein [Pseudomonadota bacterium]